MSDLKGASSTPNKCFNWIRLLLSAMLPLILGVFTIIFTLQQNSISAAARERERLHALELRQQSIYDSYISTISQLLLSSSFNRTDRNQLNHIAFKTVDVMQHLNLAQKRDVITFLYSHELNHKNKSDNQRIVLSGADLANVHFIMSTRTHCHFPDVDLREILGPGLVFERCDINRAGFEYAWLVQAKFLSSLMQSVKFYGANLTGAVFHGGNMNQVSFSHAILVNTKFSGIRPGAADFTNADLLNSNLDGIHLRSAKNKLSNTRLPNGSFSAVDSTNWMTDGSAEVACLTARHKHWTPLEGHQLLDPHDTRSFNTTDPSTAVNGHCYFRKNVSSRMIQTVRKTHYSLLINAGLAYYNLSAYMGCTLPNRSNDHVFVDMRCWNEYSDGPVCAELRMNKNVFGFQYRSIVGPVPPGNTQFRVWLQTDISFPSKPTDPIAQTCFIDDIKLVIFKKEN